MITLYRVPTITEYEGKESFALINTDKITSIQPEVITIGREYPGSKEVKVTHVVLGQESIFVPETVENLCGVLGINIVDTTVAVA